MTETLWHIDQRCTNCDVARQYAPELVAEVDGLSTVVRQPGTQAEEAALYAAAFACHTRSIRRGARGLDPAHDPFPLPLTEHVYLCGHNSPHTAGANAYLLRRPAGNLMMIDTPRFSRALAEKYAALGPVTDVLLTHRDHAAHGREYADRFGARLWIHEGDLAAAPDADHVLRGTEPTPIADGVIAHPLPGHTLGSVLYVADDTYCFSGDSMYWSRSLADLAVAESVTWYSITELAASLARTAPRLRFAWILPGHGDRKQLPPEEFARRVQDLAEHTARLRPRPIDFAAVRW
ncbi:4Fe-4S domain-containing protein [Catenulispora pinisilvae]|uniref:4Fe-4S domain-containing protein n=1 Tax=Catenulispora pinisilvae TaxID=2705253 RepID=UPI001890F5EF|nr:MBL fold metallo-hydrolase [Catenulispora pinisilvae]